MAAARRVMARHARKPVGRDKVAGPLSAIRRRFRVRRVDLVDAGQVWAIEAEVNPKKKEKTDALVHGPKRGDHIFALAFGKQLGQAHTTSAAALQALDLHRTPAARTPVDGLAIARAKDRSAGAEDATAPDNDLKRLDAALRDATALVHTGMPVDEIHVRLPAIQRRHRLTALSLVVERLAGDTT